MYYLKGYPNEETVFEETCRAFLVEADTCEIADDAPTIMLRYAVVGHRTKSVFTIEEEIIHDIRNPKSKDFFEFLSNSNIAFDDCEDLVGLVFDAEIVFDQHNKDVFPIFINRKLVLKSLNE